MSTDSGDAVRAQLRDQHVRGGHEVVRGDDHVRGLCPGGGRRGLRGEQLEVLDGLMRGIVQEPADDLQAFMVSQSGSGLRRRGFVRKVLDREDQHQSTEQ